VIFGKEYRIDASEKKSVEFVVGIGGCKTEV